MMITQLGLVFLVLISFELIKFFDLKNLIKENKNIYKCLFNDFFNDELDDLTKQKQIIKTSKTLLIISFKILLCIGIILFFIFILNYFNNGLFKFLLSVLGMMETIVFFTVYSLIRKKINE